MLVKRLIVNLRWLVYLAAIFFAARWVLEANSNETWVALIAAVAVLLADLAVQLASNDAPTSSAPRYVGELRSTLETHPGIRNYVPLHFADQSIGVTVTSIDQLNGLSRCIILGGVCVGKSTVLRRLALNAAREWQSDSQHNPLPIWLDMGRWEKGSLMRFVQRSTGLPSKALKELNVAVYLDGLDRLAVQQTAQIRQWLQKPTNRPVRAIGTCRSSAFSDLGLPFDSITLSDSLTNAQIDQFIHSYLGSQAEPLRSILLLHILDVEQTKWLAADFPQAKDPVLLVRILSAKSVEVDPDDPSPNPYQDLINRAGFLASLLLNFKSFPVVATPFNVGAVVHTILTHVWQRHSLEFSDHVPSWNDVVRISASLAHTMSWPSSHNVIQEPVSLDYLVHFNRWKGIRAAQVHRLVDHLTLAGIWQLNRTEDTVQFANQPFLEYFLAWSVEHSWLRGSFDVHYIDHWKRYSQDWDTVVIGLSALTGDPTALLEMLRKRDTVLAAKCLLSLDWRRVSRQLHAGIVDDVESLMLDPQNVQAGEDRSVEAAILLFLLSDSSAIPKMIEAMKLVKNDRFVERIASLLERYGVLALPALHRFLNTLEPGQGYSNNTFKYVVRTLAHIGSQESVVPLSAVLSQMETAEQSEPHSYEILVRAALVHLGVTSHRDVIEHRILHSPDDGRSWYGLAEVSVDFIPSLIKVLTIAAENPQQYRFDHVAQNFAKTIKYQYGAAAYPHLAAELARAQQNGVKKVLLNTLGQLGETTDGAFVLSLLQDQDPSVKFYAIEAAGRLRVAQAIPHLISLLDDADVELRYEAARALGQVGDAAAVHALEAHLVDCDDASTHPTIRSLRVCDAAAGALVSIGTGESKQIALAWCEEVIDTEPLQKAFDRTFELLVKIDTPRSFALVNDLYNRLHCWASDA